MMTHFARWNERVVEEALIALLSRPIVLVGLLLQPDLFYAEEKSYSGGYSLVVRDTV
jgi:hypothetical protein